MTGNLDKFDSRVVAGCVLIGVCSTSEWVRLTPQEASSLASTLNKQAEEAILDQDDNREMAERLCREAGFSDSAVQGIMHFAVGAALHSDVDFESSVRAFLEIWKGWDWVKPDE